MGTKSVSFPTRYIHFDTISGIVKQESKIIENSNSGPVDKRKGCSVQSQALENVMIEWVWNMFEMKINVSIL